MIRRFTILFQFQCCINSNTLIQTTGLIVMFYEYKDKRQISVPGCGDKGLNVQKIMRLLGSISVGKLHTLLLCFIAVGERKLVIWSCN